MKKNVLIILTIIIFTIIFTPMKVDAAYTDWNGYTIAGTYNEQRAWKEGNFAVHLAKNGSKYASVTCHVTMVNNTASANTHALYLEMCGSRYWVKTGVDSNGRPVYVLRGTGGASRKFTVSCSGSTGHLGVGSSASTQYSSRMFGIYEDQTDNCAYPYIWPYAKVLVPKGYKYSNTVWGYDSSKFDGHTALTLYAKAEEGSPGLFNSSVGPYASDTWKTGYMSLNVTSAAIKTRQHKNRSSNYYRYNASMGINFVPNKTTIKYNANGGSGAPSNQTKTYDSALTLTSTKPTRAGYTFSKWCTASNGTGTCYNSGGSIGATAYPTESSVTLYAIWTANKLTINYHANGGAISPSPFYNSSNGYYYKLSNSIVQSSSSSSSGFASGFHSPSYPNSVNFYNYTTFNLTRTGYHRVAGQEWMTTASGGTKYNQDTDYAMTTIASNITTGSRTITVYANWAPNDLYIKYNMNGGYLDSAHGSEIGTSGNIVTINGSQTSKMGSYGGNILSTGLANYNNSTYINIKRTGYHVEDGKEWNTNSAGTGTSYDQDTQYTVAQIADLSTGDKTVELFVRWVPNTYTVKFDANGGTGTMTDQTFTYNTAQNLRDNQYTRTNYKFIGWNTKADGTGTNYTNKESVNNLTATDNGEVRLYAQWVEDVPLIIEESGTEIPKDETGNYVIENIRDLFKVRYESDENGVISGKTEEDVRENNNPTGTEGAANKGYEFLKYTCDKNVTLNDGTVITAGNALTKQEVRQIKVKEDIVLTIHHIEMPRLTICKEVENNLDSRQFNIKVYKEGFDTTVTIAAENCEELVLESGTYKVKEILGQESSIKTITGISSNDGAITLENGNTYEIKFTNEFNKKDYLHSYGRASNKIEAS